MITKREAAVVQMFMSLSILQSIHPKYCELIASGKKTIEVRKTKPRIPTPFKVCIYETKTGYVSRSYENDILVPVKYGKVIGEYVCDEIRSFGFTPYNHGIYKVSFDANGDYDVLKESCLSFNEMYEYIGESHGYGWHISSLKLYDKPKELNEFSVIDKEFLKECPYRKRVYNNPDYTNGALLKGSYICNNSFEPDFCRGQCADATKPLTRAPQSWCYVEENNGL